MWCLVTSKGQRVVVRSLPAVVGSDQEADVVLPHESIAARHAQLSEDGDGVLAVDAIDEAVVAVDGRRVPRATLQSGDEVVLGRLRFTLVDDSARSRGPTAPRAAPPPADDGDLAPRRAPAAPPRGRTRGESRNRGQAIVVQRKPTRRGLLHADLSQLAPGTRLLVGAGVVVVAAAVLWGVQALVVALL